MKKHMERVHSAEVKYKCEECNYASSFVASLWQHTMTEHEQMLHRLHEVNSNDLSVKFIAEQNIDIMEEIEALKKDTKNAF